MHGRWVVRFVRSLYTIPCEKGEIGTFFSPLKRGNVTRVTGGVLGAALQVFDFTKENFLKCSRNFHHHKEATAAAPLE